MECHVKRYPKGENENNGHNGNVDKLLQYLLKHLHVQPDLGKLMELKKEPYPSHKDGHSACPPLPHTSTEPGLLNRADKDKDGEKYGNLDVDVSAPFSPKRPVDVEFDATVEPVKLDELVEAHEELEATRGNRGNSQNVR